MAVDYNRISHLSSLWKEGLWGKAIGLAWGAYTALLALRDGEIVDVRPSGLLPMIPNIPWAWWAVGTATVLLIWCFEASYRVHRKALDSVANLELRISSPNRIAIERMAGQLADDRLKMLDLLVISTNRVLEHSWAKQGQIVPVELAVLAARFLGDANFGELWNSYCKACLDFWNDYPSKGVKLDSSASSEIVDHYKTYGFTLQKARDDLAEYLMNIKPY